MPTEITPGLRACDLGSSSRRSLYYEDCFVGLRVAGQASLQGRRDDAADAEENGGGSLDPQVLDATVRMLLGGAFAASSRLLDFEWYARESVTAAEEMEMLFTVTRCRERSEQAGVVHVHVGCTDPRGVAVQESAATLLVPRDGREGGASALVTDFCSLAWGEALRPLLARSPAFQESTDAFDGSIGLCCGRESLQLRVYRGEILDVARATPRGPSFSLSGTELAWVGLVLAERNDFIARTSRGDFAVTGNAYEYLRMTKAIVAIWDAVRELAGPQS